MFHSVIHQNLDSCSYNTHTYFILNIVPLWIVDLAEYIFEQSQISHMQILHFGYPYLDTNG